MSKYSGISYFSLILGVFFVRRHVKALKLLQEVSHMLSYTYSSLICDFSMFRGKARILT